MCHCGHSDKCASPVLLAEAQAVVLRSGGPDSGLGASYTQMEAKVPSVQKFM